ncbi:uncharacterized protein BDW70DRAFT_146143 [Aspergillus foveolatus]|uniref:uncharacterized protein n=1 Tax=Aspergillus foveolatus TaxID=210207 RepID=UPI003CCCBF67
MTWTNVLMKIATLCAERLSLMLYCLFHWLLQGPYLFTVCQTLVFLDNGARKSSLVLPKMA